MSKFSGLTTPVKRKLNLDEAFINTPDTPSPSKNARREFIFQFEGALV